MADSILSDTDRPLTPPPRRWYVTTLGCEVVAAADFDAVVDAGMMLFAENERLRRENAAIAASLNTPSSECRNARVIATSTSAPVATSTRTMPSGRFRKTSARHPAS